MSTLAEQIAYLNYSKTQNKIKITELQGTINTFESLIAQNLSSNDGFTVQIADFTTQIAAVTAANELIDEIITTVENA